MLFQIAVDAIADGYYRDAIASATASLERFYEYASLTMFLMAGGKAEAFEATWKEVSNQSERQIGLFLGTHLIWFGAPASLISKKAVELRNKVVHKGHLPSREEAMRYVGEVMDLERLLLHTLQTQNFDMTGTSSHHLIVKQMGMPDDPPGCYMSMDLPIKVNFHSQNLLPIKIEELVDAMEELRAGQSNREQVP